METINPFTLEFGIQPPEYIDRFGELSEIIEDFSSLNPSSHVYALLGPRGCGKTAMLNDIVETLSSKPGWIAVNLNGKDNLLLQLAGALDNKVRTSSFGVEFSFSFSFLSLTLKGKEEISDIHVLIRKMLTALDKKNINVLVGIDDVAVNEHLEIFVKEFQLLRGLHLPIFAIMTGLYNVFNRLENQEGMTFLQRAKKHYLVPLNQRAISSSYQSVLGLDQEKASSLAAFTKGYAFAYQCLGYLLVKYRKKEIDDLILGKLDYYLEEGVYAKLWEGLSKKEKDILTLLAKNKTLTNQELLDSKILTPQTIAFYKKSLALKGIIDASTRGVIAMALPRFDAFIAHLTDF